MSEWRKRREQIISEYLQRNNGDVRLAIEDLKKAYLDLPTPVSSVEAVALLTARSKLEDSLKEPNNEKVIS